MTTRRDFLRGAAAMAAAPLALPPSDRITLAIIGTGSRAMFESKYWAGVPGFEVVALCDVHEPRRTEAKAAFEKLTGAKGIRLYNDFRELLRQPDVDAVYIATPDHWHVPMLVAAQKAGKMVHCEKPLGLSIEQDLAALAAVHKYKRPFFYGPERRSSADSRHAIELVLNGRIGKVQRIYLISPPSISGGKATPGPVPAGFDWDLWLGPAPHVPYAPERHSGYNIFHISDYSLGFLSNWGTHPLDQLQWWADNAGMGIPVKYKGSGTLAKEGLFDCATAWDLECTYADGTVLHYMDHNTYNAKSGVPRPKIGNPQKIHDGTFFVGSEGTVAWTYAGVVTEPASLMTSEIGASEKRLVVSPAHPEKAQKGNVWEAPAALHQLAWLETLKSGKQGVHTIETAVQADLFCQLCDLTIRTGAPLEWDPKKRTILGNDAARRRMSKPMRKPWSLA